MEKILLKLLFYLKGLWRIPLEGIGLMLFNFDRHRKTFDNITISVPCLVEGYFKPTVTALEEIKNRFPDQYDILQDNIVAISYTRKGNLLFSLSHFFPILTINAKFVSGAHRSLSITRILLRAAVLIDVYNRFDLPKTRRNSNRLSQALTRRVDSLVSKN